MALINMTSRDGVILHTAGKYCEEDIAVVPTFESGGEGGDLGINGVIRSYQVNAGKSVSAGDFVEFVTNWGNGEFNYGTATEIAAVALSENKVLIAYSDDGNSEYGTAAVITIDGTTVDVGPKYVFLEKSFIYSSCSLLAISSNTALLSYEYGATAYYVTLSVDGTTVSTVGVLEHGDERNFARAYELPSGKILLIETYYYSLVNNNTTARISVCSMIDNVLVEEFYSSSQGRNWLSISAVALSENKVLVTYTRPDEGTFACVLTIGETSISWGEELKIANFHPDETRSILVSENLVLIVSGVVASSEASVYAYIVSIDGIVITLYDTNRMYSTTQNVSDFGYISLSRLSEDKFLIAGGGFVAIAQVDIANKQLEFPGSGLAFNEDSTYNPSAQHTSLAVTSPDTALVIFSDTSIGLYRCLKIDGYDISIQETEKPNGVLVQPATSRLHNVGVAKTGGVGGQMVDVYCVN